MDQSEDSKDQALATKEFSEYDLMHMNFFLDVSGLSISKSFTYESSFNIVTNYFKHANNTERLRRAKLYLEGTRYMNDYASQARNAVSGEPQKALIVFDPLLGRKASRYFTASEQEQKNILAELDAKKAKYFLGDDLSKYSVYQAYSDALAFLNDKTNTLFDPSNNAEVKTFAEAFGNE
jgi:CRISPR-associated protein Cst2